MITLGFVLTLTESPLHMALTVYKNYTTIRPEDGKEENSTFGTALFDHLALFVVFKKMEPKNVNNCRSFCCV